MKYISHRGNLVGREPSRENSPDYIDQAIDVGFDVEIDLFYQNGNPYLGHDRAEYPVTERWILSRKNSLWVHCKNIQALDKMVSLGVHCFSHDTDYATLTSRGAIWAYPGKEIYSHNVVIVLPERQEEMTLQIDRGYLGVCSDYIEIIKENHV